MVELKMVTPQNLDLNAQDTASTLSVSLIDQDGNPVDLTGATVNLQFYINSHPPVFIKAMTIDNVTTGKVHYKFVVDNSTGTPVYDLAVAGILYYKIKVTLPDATVITTPFEGEITIHEPLV